ncbi:hypothetical protein [Cohnella nanjingensis]|uniref:Uncharacterized protein n=1 Tax=Cohnella nanjingensis TaxID=1387779 RepID=A0A7X0RUR8_9BACL|nr:hypothetical protein [Cohnella nanjingensis]MBB6674067.1 hypothetical protein [Cohnella nanjingensis]
MKERPAPRRHPQPGLSSTVSGPAVVRIRSGPAVVRICSSACRRSQTAG